MSMDMKSKCRTCLSESSSCYYQIFDYAEENCKIFEMIDCLVPQIEIKSSPQFSNFVCQMCVEKLLIGYKFQQLCIKSNKTYQELLDTAVTGTIEIESAVDPLKTEPDQTQLNIEIEEGIFIETILNARKKSNKECLSDSNVWIRSFSDEAKVEGTAKAVADIQHSDLKKLPPLKCRFCPKIFDEAISLSAHYKDHKHKLLIENKTQITSELRDVLQSPTKIKGKEDEKPDNNFNIKLAIRSGTGETNELGSIHSESTNVEQSVFDCVVCGKRFHRSWSLQRHSSVHSLDRPYECEICKYRFSDEKVFKAHLYQHRTEGEKDINQHPLKNHKCEICQRKFINIQHLGKHLKNQHPEVGKKHTCDYCSRKFISQNSLLIHINYKHKSDKSLSCEICKKAFVSTHRLASHILVHKSYLCPHCGKTFLGPSNLNQHIQRHIGLLNYQCLECPKRFNCKSDLIKHLPTHLNTKPYACDVCGSRFSREHSMKKHKLLHTAERTHKCMQCNKTFKLRGHLNRHMRTHTGEKPHKCKYCERAYLASGDLVKHLRTHVGENTYKCDQCPDTFKYQAELFQHQNQHYKMSQTHPQRAQEISKEPNHNKINLIN